MFVDTVFNEVLLPEQRGTRWSVLTKCSLKLLFWKFGYN